MARWDGIEETRLLIAPAPAPTTATGNGEGLMLSLRHPKSGNQTCYFLNNGSIQELHWFKQSYGSWFLGDYVCEDGGLYIATPIDPVFLLLPIFEEARMKNEGDQGKFRQLDEILFVNTYPGFQHLLSIAEDSMQIVCEMKEVGSSKFFRLNDSKVLAWLCHKVHQLKMTLPTLDKNYGAQNEKDMLTEVVSILGEYLKEEPWLNLLCSHLKLDRQQEASRQAAHSHEFLPGPLESTSFDQAKSGSNKKASSNKGKETNKKKMKTETNSQDIKDMFRRATRSSSSSSQAK
ncbi:Ribonuclease H2 [Macleaya cordata]|uniref:Ribonuclease H2 subunit B n=1 Tax=Macleaya cordata TaxID=56857 RepID=A0A200QD43_MACCD|nr:Ribonuclease H2 [Macleaya cordata]